MAIERNQVPNPNTEDCNWLSIAGTVTGLLGEPLTDIAVEVSGDQFLEVRFSGTAPAWGPSGFEINVGNRPAAREFAVRLLSATGDGLSDYVLLTTGTTCQTNVTVVNFRQLRD